MLFTPVLLFLGVGVGVGAVTFTHEFVENDLISECRTTGSEALEYEWSGRPRVDRSYIIVLGGMGRHRECPEGTWICMTGTRGDFDNTQHEASPHTFTHTPIAGKSRPGSVLVDQGTNAIASILSNNDNPATPHLNLFLIGGFHEGTAQYALIDLVCDLNVDLGAPAFAEERDGVHIFTWITKHACSVAGNMSTLETMPPPGPDAEPEQGEGEKDLINMKPSPMTFLRRMVFPFIAMSSILTALCIVLARPYYRHLFLTQLKSLSERVSLPFALPQSLQFRVGESRLVRWAQEDMSLGFDEAGHGEVDVMVNGSTGGGNWEAQGLDEYIPLKSGSMKSLKGYGSTPPGQNIW